MCSKVPAEKILNSHQPPLPSTMTSAISQNPMIPLKPHKIVLSDETRPVTNTNEVERSAQFETRQHNPYMTCHKIPIAS